MKSELFRQGGLEKYTWQIARDLCALGAPVTVLTSGNVVAPFVDPLLNVVSLPVHHSLSFLNVMHFDKATSAYLGENPSPIVFSLDRNRFQTHIRAGNGVHASYLHRRAHAEGFATKLSFALNPLHQTILSIEKKAFEHPDLKVLFTNSEMVKKEVLQFYNTDPEKIHVVHNGVEWHGLQNAFDTWESNSETFQFLFIGHNYRRKGLDKLL
ncbi:MAG: glycosyltransferase, partial [Candidatus Melainabacteria bacterium]|nr:glycosyltransferase [Candidatus Melainabacteria bacterium]